MMKKPLVAWTGALVALFLCAQPSARADAVSDADLLSLNGFAVPLIPSGPTTPSQNTAFSAAANSWLQRQSQDDFTALRSFANSNSPWKMTALLNLAAAYYQAGWFSKALETYEEAWEAGRTLTTESGRSLANQAAAGKMGMLARVGRKAELEAFVAELGDRPVSGPAAELMSQAKSGLADMNTRPGRSFKCGPMALLNVRKSMGSVPDAVVQAIHDVQSPPTGFNLQQLSEMSESLGVKLQPAFREPGSQVIVPSIVNWKLAHYGALVALEEGKYHLVDPTFMNEFWITSVALDEQSSGYFLVPEGPLPAGWRAVEKEEAETVWGKGTTTSSDGGATGAGNLQCPDGKCGTGMPSASVDAMLVSLTIQDIPLVYSPARGPGGPFKVYYSQRITGLPTNPNFTNLGPQWACELVSFVTYNPNSASATVSLFDRTGGTTTYAGFNSSNNTSSAEWASAARLVRSAATGSLTFEKRNPDGSKEVYARDDGTTISGGTTSKRVFLTQVVDAQGDALTFTYDSQNRVTQITDASGLSTTFEYTLSAVTIPANAYKVTKATDPFGRTALFGYDANGKLNSITDALGLTSTFTYSATNPNFIDTMTTPYGTTKFAFGEAGTARWLETTNPLGDTERVEFRNSTTNTSVSASEVPSGMGVLNQWMDSRNTFYWDKKAYKEAKGDYSKAKNYHWLHTSANTNVTDRIPESIKDAFSSRVWFNYVGTSMSGSGPVIAGTMARPTRIGRVVDGPDGTSMVTQLTQNAYNTQGNLTETIDPAGRRTVLTYAANGIDLIKVEQSVSGTLKQVFAATYNSNHLPLTVTDAAGQVTTTTYNANGQPLTISNPKGEVTTFTYNAEDRLASIDGPLSGSTDSTTIDYDAAGRVESVTDPDGYTLEYAYDALDRLTQVTYPDSTTEIRNYSSTNLNLDSTTDRLGRTTSYTYNAIQQLIGVRDPLGRVTAFDWCKCGAMKSLTDAMGRTTRWQHDVQSRLIGKIYPDGTKTTYTYDRSSRLSAVKDALNQVRTTRYNVDDTPASILYTGEVNATPDVTLSWDASFRRLTSVVDGTGTTGYTYHPITSSASLGAGRLATVDGPLANDTVSYTYDALGRVLTKAIDSISSSYTYDAAGRITQVINALGQFDYTYDGTSRRLATATAPNGVVTALSYLDDEGDHRLESIVNTGPGSTAISSYEYVTNAVGQITQWTQDQGSAVEWTIQQDAADQLTRVSVAGQPSATENFAYDFAGNRIRNQKGDSLKTGTFNNLNQLTSLSSGGKLKLSGITDEPSTVTVQGQPARMTSATNFTAWPTVTTGTNSIPVVATDGSGNSQTNNYQVVVPSVTGRSFTYDAVGNTLSDGLRTMEWDAENRLIKITQGGDVYEWAYNAFGERVSEKKNGSVIKQWLWTGGFHPSQERDGDGVLTKQFFDQGEKQGNACFYYSKDHLDSIRGMTDTVGDVVVRYAYSSWGDQELISGNDLSSFGFTGHLRQKDVDLVFAKFRAYDPSLGRWISRDPIGEKGGLNLYGYVGDAPITDRDPTGLQKVGRCEVYLFYGHGSRRGKNWNVDPSAAAGQISCFPAANNANIPPDQRIPGLPTHDGIMTTGDDVFNNKLKDVPQIDPNYDPVADQVSMQKALKNAVPGIAQKIRELCNGCCREDPGYVTLKIEMGGGWFGIGHYVGTYKFPCN